MTLILTALTPDHIVQVSDRRLTNSLSGRVFEDEANKALLFCGHATLSLTGLAETNGDRLDEIMMESIAPARSLVKALELGSATLTKTLRSFSPPGFSPAQRRATRRVAFVVGSFVQDSNSGSLVPVYAVLSNFFDGNGGWMAEAETKFDWWMRPLGASDDFTVFSAGVALSEQSTVRLHRLIRNVAQHGTGPSALARILVSTLRGVADVNQAVGRSVMVTTLRRMYLTPGSPNIGSEMIALDPYAPDITRFRESPDPQGWSWMYIPGAPGEAVHHGPLVACAGIQMKGMVFGPTDELKRLGLPVE